MRIVRRRTGTNTATQQVLEELSVFIPVGFEGITPAEPKLFSLEITPAEAAQLGVPGPTVDVFWLQTINRFGDGNPALFNSPYDMPLNADISLHADDTVYEAALVGAVEQHLINSSTEYMIPTAADKLAFGQNFLSHNPSVLRPL